MADSKIVQYTQSVSWDAQKPETKHLTKRAVIDAIGCALAGSTHDTVPGVINSMSEIDGKGWIGVWGTKAALDLKGAIFVNAYTAALFDMDDGHRRAQGHPGAVIVPAVLCVGAKLGCSGKAMLEAVIVGYDVAIREAVRIREAGGPRKGSSGWCAPGCAAAVGKLLKLTDQQMCHAIGISEYLTPQAGQDRSVNFPSMTKEGIPWGAYTGSFCAHLAKGGFSGHRPHLSDEEELCKDLGERVEVDFTYYKKWSACRWAHPALGGMEQMRAEKPFSITDVKHVQLRSFEKGLLLCNRKPNSTLQAVYSIPFSLAYWLKHGKIEPDNLKDEVALVNDPEVCDMATRIDMEHAPEFTLQFPLKCIQDVTVTFQDGSTMTKTQLEAPWDAGERAPSDEEINKKFQTLAEPVLGAKWKELLDMLTKLDEVDDVGKVAALMVTSA
jgi:2-methylcitrate dehydratase PrpD